MPNATVAVRIIAIYFLGLCAGAPASASVIQVAPGNVTAGDSASCSLVDAVAAANASIGSNVTVGACAPSGTPDAGGGGYHHGDVIVLAAGSYTFVVADNSWYGHNALPPIASDIIIVGDPGRSFIERQLGSAPFRLFYVGGGQSLAGYNAPNISSGTLPGPGALTLVNLTVRGGIAQGGDGMYGGGGGGLGAGGAIYNQGQLTLQGVTLANNQALGGGTPAAGASARFSGGGMGADGTTARGGGFDSAPWPVEAAASGSFGNGGDKGSDCATAGCTAADGDSGGVGGGGGAGGTVPIANGPSSGTAGDGGNGGFGGGGGAGGISPDLDAYGRGGDGGFGGGGGTNRDIFAPDSGGGFGGGDSDTGGGGGAGLGGAIFNEGGAVSIANSTLTSNHARGGRVHFAADPGDGYGGAMFNLNGSVNIAYSTLAGNTAAGGGNDGGGGVGSGKGGAIYNLYLPSPGSPAADTSSAASITIQSSALAYSTGTSGLVSDCENDGGTFASDHSIVQRPGSCSLSPSDHSSDPRLASLAYNGGATKTMLPDGTSPVINAGADDNCPASDQRGVPRPKGAHCDVGALEVPVASQIIAANGSGQTATIWHLFFNPLMVQVLKSDGTPVPMLTLHANPTPAGPGLPGAWCADTQTNATGLAYIYCRANGMAGSYTVEVQAVAWPDLPAALFLLSNTVGNGDTIFLDDFDPPGPRTSMLTAASGGSFALKLPGRLPQGAPVPVQIISDSKRRPLLRVDAKRVGQRLMLQITRYREDGRLATPGAWQPVGTAPVLEVSRGVGGLAARLR